MPATRARWYCPRCGRANPTRSVVCAGCKLPRPPPPPERAPRPDPRHRGPDGARERGPL